MYRASEKEKIFLMRAIELSSESVKAGGYPAGSVVVGDDEIIGEGISNGMQLKDATSHAEVAAIRDAEHRIGKRDLTGATLFCSLEPCLMCFSASYWTGITKIIYACGRDKVTKREYEGDHNIIEINQKCYRQLTIIHAGELEQSALEIFKKWRKDRLQNKAKKSTPSVEFLAKKLK